MAFPDISAPPLPVRPRPGGITHPQVVLSAEHARLHPPLLPLLLLQLGSDLLLLLAYCAQLLLGSRRRSLRRPVGALSRPACISESAAFVARCARVPGPHHGKASLLLPWQGRRRSGWACMRANCAMCAWLPHRVARPARQQSAFRSAVWHLRFLSGAVVAGFCTP